jgi:predicted peptidase
MMTPKPYKSLLFLILISFSGFAQMTPKPYAVKGQMYGYLEHLPEGYSTDICGKKPLLIFLHGIGEKGYGDTNSLKLLYRHGPPKLISLKTWKAISGDRFIVIAPQCQANFFNPDNLRKFIDYIKVTYNVDTERVYLTGLSAGAFGIWNYLYKYQDQISAAIPICGNGNSVTLDTARNKLMAKIPIWAFHGDKDATVTYKGSVNPVNRLNAVGGKNKVTIYSGVGHDSWSRTYDLSGQKAYAATYSPYDMSIYDWLLQFKKDGI